MTTTMQMKLFVFGMVMSMAFMVAHATSSAGMPVIIDTDVGSVFDDSAAIAVALQRPELDVKLIVTATGDTMARARVVAKFLQAVGRTDVAVGVGVATANHTLTPLYAWAQDYDLDAYPGKVYRDGVGAAVDVVQAASASQPVTLIAIAPATNFPDMLARGGPSFVARARVVAMSGSIFKGYNNSNTPTAEYNVKVCPSCMRQVYAAGWPVVSTPLDTCGVVALSGTSLDAWLTAPTPLASVLAQSFVFWFANCPSCGWHPGRGLVTDVWFDVAAVYLAVITRPPTPAPAPARSSSSVRQRPPPADSGWVMLQTLRIAVTPSGDTVIDDARGNKVTEALAWKDLSAVLLWIGASLGGDVNTL